MLTKAKYKSELINIKKAGQNPVFYLSAKAVSTNYMCDKINLNEDLI